MKMMSAFYPNLSIEDFRFKIWDLDKGLTITLNRLLTKKISSSGGV